MVVYFAEKYFDMNKKHCREAFGLYKKFLVRMDKVAEFLKVAEVSGKEGRKGNRARYELAC